MGKAIVYTYTLLPRLSRYLLDGRYNIDNNGVENAIRPLALGRLCGVQHKAARTTCSAETMMPRRGLRLCTRSLPPAKPTTSWKGPGWKMSSAGCRNTNLAKRTSLIFFLGTGHLPNAKVTQTDIKLTQIRMQLAPHPCQLHLTLSSRTSSDAYTICNSSDAHTIEAAFSAWNTTSIYHIRMCINQS